MKKCQNIIMTLDNFIMYYSFRVIVPMGACLAAGLPLFECLLHPNAERFVACAGLHNWLHLCHLPFQVVLGVYLAVHHRKCSNRFLWRAQSSHHWGRISADKSDRGGLSPSALSNLTARSRVKY